MSDDDERHHDEHLVSIEDVRAFVLAAVAPHAPLGAESLPIPAALRRVLAEPVVADVELPRFTNSAMDGYALRAADSTGAPVRLRVVGKVMAGEAPPCAIGPGEAMRIMTGAPVPEGADAVCMVERTRALGGEVVEIADELRVGENVRPRGHDLAIGAEVFAAGTVLTPAHLGVLESLGHETVRVHRLPRVGVISTGDELVRATGELPLGKIRDSNRPSLLAQLTDDGYPAVDLGWVPDELEPLTKTIADGLEHCDVIFASGGVSVGDRDFVKLALETLGPDTTRWVQVAVKPAKPFCFSTLGPRGAPVFGFPGNPVSALISYEMFARPTLRMLAGHRILERARMLGVADERLRRRPDGKVHLQRVEAGIGADGRLHVRPSGGQDSHMLRALADANALAILPDGDSIEAGEPVEVIVLDADRLDATRSR